MVRSTIIDSLAAIKADLMDLRMEIINHIFDTNIRTESDDKINKPGLSPWQLKPVSYQL